jgi:hypothetical protein
MLDLHEKLAADTIPADKELYQRQIKGTDAEIDALVYELYGLTEEESARETEHWQVVFENGGTDERLHRRQHLAQLLSLHE